MNRLSKSLRPRSWLPLAALLLCLPLSGGSLPTDGIALASVHAVVGLLDKDEILFAKREETPVPIASITKLMTAMVVLDGKQSLDEWLPVVARKNSYGKNGFSRLRIGAETTRATLLRLMLMSSENLAAYNLAHHYPGGVEAFVEAMNAKAGALEMRHSRFDDPAGLSPGNRSTAADLLKMARAAHDYATIRDYSTTYQYTARFRSPTHTIAFGNTNPLTASSRWELGMSKTGYLSEAGRCLVMVAQIEEQPIVIVLLNSFGTRTPLGDAGRVRRWLETGSGGSVAKDAQEYERRIVAGQHVDDGS